MRTRFKSRLLSLTRDQVVQAAGKYFDKTQAEKAVAVISGEDKLKAANEKLAGKPLTLRRI
jgi:Zn-dependent M16 (insulinase) family peptidase